MLEWLKEILGEAYTEDVDKKVSVEIGKNFVAKTDFNQLNETKKSLEKQIGERDSQLEELKKVDADGLQARINELQQANETAKAEHEKQLSDLQFGFILENEISSTKAKNTKAVKALLDMDGLKLNDGKIVGLDDQLQKIKAENEYLFESDKKIPQFSASTPGAETDAMSAIRAAAGLKITE